jgi:hypothetical protein
VAPRKRLDPRHPPGGVGSNGMTFNNPIRSDDLSLENQDSQFLPDSSVGIMVSGSHQFDETHVSGSSTASCGANFNGTSSVTWRYSAEADATHVAMEFAADTWLDVSMSKRPGTGGSPRHLGATSVLGDTGYGSSFMDLKPFVGVPFRLLEDTLHVVLIDLEIEQELTESITGSLTVSAQSKAKWQIHSDIDGDGLVDPEDVLVAQSYLDLLVPQGQLELGNLGTAQLSNTKAVLTKGNYIITINMYAYVDATASLGSSACGVSNSGTALYTQSARLSMSFDTPCGSIDFNANNQADEEADWDAFLDAWSSGNPGDLPNPDFNRDGVLDSFDLTTFANAYAEGACRGDQPSFTLDGANCSPPHHDAWGYPATRPIAPSPAYLNTSFTDRSQDVVLYFERPVRTSAPEATSSPVDCDECMSWHRPVQMYYWMASPNGGSWSNVTDSIEAVLKHNGQSGSSHEIVLRAIPGADLFPPGYYAAVVGNHPYDPANGWYQHPVYFEATATTPASMIRPNLNGLVQYNFVLFGDCQNNSTLALASDGLIDASDAPCWQVFRNMTSACPADISGSGVGGRSGFEPDGYVDVGDLITFIEVFSRGLQVADLDNGTGTGTPDGNVDTNDLLFFLAHFELGC